MVRFLTLLTSLFAFDKQTCQTVISKFNNNKTFIIKKLTITTLRKTFNTSLTLELKVNVRKLYVSLLAWVPGSLPDRGSVFTRGAVRIGR